MEVKQPKYEMVDVEILIPYVNNAKMHSDAQVTALASSIKEFGFLSPMVIDKNNGITAGHGRLMAAKKLGLTKVPCIIADHLTEAQKKAYVLADNRLAEFGSSWDKDLLKIELDDIKDNFNLDDIGFDAGFLSDLDIGKDSEENKNEPNKEIKEGDDEFLIVIEAENEVSQSELYEELIERGVKCKIM